MMTLVNSPQDLAIISAIQAWIMDVLPLDISHVIEAHDNSVAMPSDPFIIMSHIRRTPLGLPTQASTDTGSNTTSTTTVTQSINYEWQLDCYGAQASDYIMVLHVLSRSGATSEWFEEYGSTNGITIDPLYADDPTHTAIVNDEDQYEERWTLRMRFNVVINVAAPVGFMSSAKIKPLINVSTLPR